MLAPDLILNLGVVLRRIMKEEKFLFLKPLLLLGIRTFLVWCRMEELAQNTSRGP